MRPVLDNIHITSVETIEEIADKKNKNSNINTDAHHDNGIKVQNVTNFNNMNSPNKQSNSNQSPEKNEIFYPAYPSL